MTNNNTPTTEKSANDLKAKIEAIPNKMGFKIGEVAELVGVKQYVLRYWESEFDGLHPRKSHNGQRFYTRKDIEMALMIRKLLHEDRFSIEGARAVLKKMKQAAKAQPAPAPIAKGTTEAQIVEAHQPAKEVVIKTVPAAAPVAATAAQVEKAIVQREKELKQNWRVSMEGLISEVRLARKRLLGA